MPVGMIGLGNMGTAIAKILAENGRDVLGWEHNADVVKEINAAHTNSRFLPDVPLPENLRATSSLRDVFQTASVLFVAIPSVFFRPTFEPFAGAADKLFVNLAKGIDPETLLTGYETLRSLFPRSRHVMLSGPSIANEFSRGLPTVVVLAGPEKKDLLQVARLVESESFRVRFSDDVTGVELGGILKNIYAIGLGLFDGLGIHSINFRASYLTLALEEMARLGVALGARRETFLYLTCMGDLLATSLSPHSHNRRLGELMAKGLSLEEAKSKMGVLPEGYNTLKIALYLAEKYHRAMPLAKGLWDVLQGRLPADRFVRTFTRDFVE